MHSLVATLGASFLSGSGVYSTASALSVEELQQARYAHDCHGASGVFNGAIVSVTCLLMAASV